MADIPKIWEILGRFKRRCETKGWKTSQSEDWIKEGNKYHNFLWTPTVHLSTFERIAANRRCAINEGISYRVVNVSYTAWLFPQSPPEALIRVVTEDPELLRRNAIYDLSAMYAGKPTCLKLNETDSTVFREFEGFLKEKLGVKVKLAREPCLEV